MPLQTQLPSINHQLSGMCKLTKDLDSLGAAAFAFSNKTHKLLFNTQHTVCKQEGSSELQAFWILEGPILPQWHVQTDNQACMNEIYQPSMQK